MHSNYTFVFFGSDDFSISILDALCKAGFVPSLVVAPPDRKQGRGMQLTAPATKIWAEEHSIEVFQPETLDDNAVSFLKEKIYTWDFFVVASYGLIIPQTILEIPTYGALNVHPSLLPKYRGATPVESAMLADDKETGVTIMLMDNKMDHGPL